MSYNLTSFLSPSVARGCFYVLSQLNNVTMLFILLDYTNMQYFWNIFVLKCIILLLLEVCASCHDKEVWSSWDQNNTSEKADRALAHSLRVSIGKSSVTACSCQSLLSGLTPPPLQAESDSPFLGPAAAASPGRSSLPPRGRAPSSHPLSSAIAASRASRSRNVSSAGSYTSLKAPWPTCPYNGVGMLGAAIFLLAIRRICVNTAHAQVLLGSRGGVPGGEWHLPCWPLTVCQLMLLEFLSKHLYKLLHDWHLLSSLDYLNSVCGSVPDRMRQLFLTKGNVYCTFI